MCYMLCKYINPTVFFFFIRSLQEDSIQLWLQHLWYHVFIPDTRMSVRKNDSLSRAKNEPRQRGESMTEALHMETAEAALLNRHLIDHRSSLAARSPCERAILAPSCSHPPPRAVPFHIALTSNVLANASFLFPYRPALFLTNHAQTLAQLTHGDGLVWGRGTRCRIGPSLGRPPTRIVHVSFL